MSIKILIADDHDLVRNGLKTLLANTDIEVAAEVASGDAAVKWAIAHKPPKDG